MGRLRERGQHWRKQESRKAGKQETVVPVQKREEKAG